MSLRALVAGKCGEWRNAEPVRLLYAAYSLVILLSVGSLRREDSEVLRTEVR